MALIRRFEVQFEGYLIMADADPATSARRSLEPGMRDAIAQSATGQWLVNDLTDPDADQHRVEFQGELFVDAVHADAAAEKVFDLLNRTIADAADANAGCDWEIVRIIDPEPDPRDRQYFA